MFKLTKLVFIDSYSSGKRAIVNLEGSTNLNGDNGFGKTTMLRVLPLFFGAAPGQLVRQSGTNKSFVDYYLPRSTSYIIFEYERDSEKNLVVIFRGDNALRFSFLKQPYDDKFFFSETNEKSNVIASSDWLRTMKLDGYHPSQRFGVADYKSIIQSGLNFTESSDRRRKTIINEHRARYSFCRRGTSIQNIDLITTAILEREPSIEAIKEILSNILTQNSTAGFEEIPQLTIKSSKLTEWINDRNSYQAMSQCEPDIAEITRLKYQYDDCISRQKTLRSQAKMTLNILGKELDVAIPSRDRRKSELDSHVGILLKQSRAYKENKLSLESELTITGNRIASLESDRDSFIANNIEESQKLVRQIPTITERLGQLNHQYQVLINEQQDIENKFEKLANQLKESLQSKLLAFTEEENSHLKTYQNSLSSLSDERQQQLQTEEVKHEKALEKLQKRAKEAELDKTKYETSLQSISPPTELKDALQASEKRLNSLNLKTSSLDKRVAEASFAEQNHNEQIRLLSIKANDFEREKRELDIELEQLRRLNNPEKNNLLSFLRENHKNWTANIARVVPEELLLRTDLCPEISKSDDSLYGLKIDLSVIDTARAADESLLQNQILLVNDELAKKEVQINEVKDEAKQLQGQSKTFEVAIFEAENSRQKHDISISETQEQLQIYQSKISAAVADIKKDTESKILNCKERLAIEESRIKEQRQSYDVTKKSIHHTFNEGKARLDRYLQEKRKSVSKKKTDAQDSYDQEVIKLSEQKALALIEQGVDPKHLTFLSTRQKEENQKLKTAKDSQPLVEKYEAWLRTEWADYQDLQTKFRHLNEELNQCIEDWKLEEEDLRVREKELEIIWEQEKKKCERIDNDITQTRRLLDNFTDNGELSEDEARLIDSLTNISLLESRWKTAINEHYHYESEGVKAYNRVRKSISAFRDSPPQKYLEMITAHFTQKSQHFQNEWLFAATRLSDYMRQSHQEHLSLLQNDAHLLGQQISDHHTVLSRIHKEINQLGRKVSHHSQAVIADFSAVDNLTITVKSKLDQLEFWSALEKFSLSHQAWIARTGHDLPDEDYIEKLKLIAKLFEKSGTGIKLSKSFETSFNMSEQGTSKVARTDKELDGISSNGISYLVIISVYTALVNMLRGDSGAVMIWPVDELRNFSANNTVKLMNSLEQQNVYLFSAFPDPDPELLKHYTNRYMIKAGRTLVQYPDDFTGSSDYLDSLLASTEL